MSRTSTGAALACCTLAMLGAAAVSAGALADAPANTWVKVESSETGGRYSPAFFYVPELKRFVLAGGIPCGGEKPVAAREGEEREAARGRRAFAWTGSAGHREAAWGGGLRRHPQGVRNSETLHCFLSASALPRARDMPRPCAWARRVL